METALQIKRNAEEQQSAIKDLLKWEDEVKVKDKKAVGEKVYHVPIRTTVANTTVKNDRISSLDYRKWDSFNVDKELENVDYETSKEQVKIKEKVIKNNEDALVEKEKGNLYFKKQKFQKAIICYTKSIELNMDIIPLVNRALCYLKIQDYQNAEQDCDKVLEIDVKNIKALHRRGLARKNRKKYLEAKRDFEDCLILEPTNSTIKKDLQELENIISIFNGKTTRKRIEIEEINKPIARAAENDRNGVAVNEPVLLPKVEIVEANPTESFIETIVPAEEPQVKPAERVKKVEIAEEKVEPKEVSKKLPEMSKVKQEKNSMAQPEIKVDATKLEKPKTLFEFEQNWKNLDRESQYLYLKVLFY
ncbi:hypothetical protein HDV01_005938 [Terramyces sp. JEL0728]|nr:hypothetical protein HDV01_005938 [Terramyces sp. JEL0728]